MRHEDNNITGCVLRTLNDFSHFMLNKAEVWGCNISMCLPRVQPSAPGYFMDSDSVSVTSHRPHRPGYFYDFASRAMTQSLSDLMSDLLSTRLISLSSPADTRFKRRTVWEMISYCEEWGQQCTHRTGLFMIIVQISVWPLITKKDEELQIMHNTGNFSQRAVKNYLQNYCRNQRWWWWWWQRGRTKAEEEELKQEDEE